YPPTDPLCHVFCSYLSFYRRIFSLTFFFFNDTATTEIYPLSLHDALPIYVGTEFCEIKILRRHRRQPIPGYCHAECINRRGTDRSEEHTSELQSLTNLVCRLLLEKKKT